MRDWFVGCTVALALSFAAQTAAAATRVWDFTETATLEDWQGGEFSPLPDGARINVATAQTSLQLKRSLEAADYRYLTLEIRTLENLQRSGYVHWQNSTSSRRSRVNFYYAGKGEITLEIDLAESPEWLGRIEGFSIAFSDQQEKLIVQKIKLAEKRGPEDAKLEWIGDFDIDGVLRQPARPVMIYILALGDANCKKMNEEIFKNSAIAFELQDYDCIRLLVDEKDRFAKYVGSVVKVPTLFFLQYDPAQQKLVELQKLEGYHTVEQMQRYLEVLRKRWQ